MELFAADRKQVDSGVGWGGVGRDAVRLFCGLLLCVYPALFCPCSSVAVPLIGAVNCGFGHKLKSLCHNRLKGP